MTLDWLDAFLISGFFHVVVVVGLGLLLHLQLGLTRIAQLRALRDVDEAGDLKAENLK